MLNFQYDPDLTIRGLHYDITNGLLIKVNAVLQIQSDAVFRGKYIRGHTLITLACFCKFLTNSQIYLSPEKLRKVFNFQSCKFLNDINFAQISKCQIGFFGISNCKFYHLFHSFVEDDTLMILLSA